jgi:ABC-type ATPase involved in cell division
MFDVPTANTSSQRWQGELPLHERPWNVGLIVGPSGCGKSTIASALWPKQMSAKMSWHSASVIDDVAAERSVQEVSETFGAVGFNTIPAWLRPFAVLSNGEKFRVELARRVLEANDLVVVDEFTSVVDRQVARVGSHAVQKLVRRADKQFVAVSCHHDIIDWLQPDWILEPATMTFAWRSVQPRPKLVGHVHRTPYATWSLFAPYHYLTAELAKSARCFALSVDARPVSFIGAMHFPHPKVNDIMRVSRAVTLPDWQGLGLFFHLSETVGAAYKAIGKRLRIYPAHAAFIRSCERSSAWRKCAEAGFNSTPASRSASKSLSSARRMSAGDRPCAVFEYCGAAMSSRHDAQRLLG